MTVVIRFDGMAGASATAQQLSNMTDQLATLIKSATGSSSVRAGSGEGTSGAFDFQVSVPAGSSASEVGATLRSKAFRNDVESSAAELSVASTLTVSDVTIEPVAFVTTTRTHTTTLAVTTATTVTYQSPQLRSTTNSMQTVAPADDSNPLSGTERSTQRSWVVASCTLLTTYVAFHWI